jgi:pilus assembly protein CpaE
MLSISLLDGYALISTHAEAGQSGGLRALLICPDGRMSAELSGALAAELPAASISATDVYPGPGERLLASPEPQLCFLDVVSDVAIAGEVLARLAADFPELPIVVLLSANAPDLILSCLRHGAAEFLIQPFTAEELGGVIRKLARFRNGLTIPERSGGRVFCVMPGKGASGATTLACNLAVALHRIHGARTLLADLDGLTGTIGFVLKLQSAYSFVDAVNQASALDGGMWKALVNPSNGIDVLLSPDPTVDCYAEAMDPAVLVSSARHAYELVVIDASDAHGRWNCTLARLASDLLLVTTGDGPALHATRRSLDALEANGVSRSKPRIILNRHEPKHTSGLEAVAGVLGMQVFRTLPADDEPVASALMEGKPVASQSRFGRSIAALAQALEGEQRPPLKPSLFSALSALFRPR